MPPSMPPPVPWRDPRSLYGPVCGDLTMRAWPERVIPSRNRAVLVNPARRRVMRCHCRRLSSNGATAPPDDNRTYEQVGSTPMWDTVETNTGPGSVHLSHDLPCTDCG